MPLVQSQWYRGTSIAAISMLINNSAAHSSSCGSPPVRLYHYRCNNTDAHSAGTNSLRKFASLKTMSCSSCPLFDPYKWRCMQGASEKIKARSPYHRTSAVFHAWRNAVTEERRVTLKMQQVISRMVSMRLSQVFGMWQVYVDEQTLKRQQLQKAVVRLQRLRCSAVLFGWFRLTLQTKATQGQLLKAVR